MNLEEKFTLLIRKVEECATKEEEPILSQDIPLLIGQSFGLSIRDIATVFKFMTDRSLLDYIKDRKMMAALKYLLDNRKDYLENKQHSICMDKAVTISGYDNQSSFTKKFSSAFNVGPVVAIKKNQTDLLSGPLTWGQIIEIQSEKTKGQEIETVKTNTLFGIDKEILQRLRHVLDLQGIYDFSDRMCDIICQYAEKHSIDLEKAFKYFDEMMEWCAIDSNCDMYQLGQYEKELIYDQSLKTLLEDKNLIKYSFFSILTVDEGIYVWFRLKNHFGEDIPELSDAELFLLTSDIDTEVCISCGQYYMEHERGKSVNRAKIEVYLENLCRGDYICMEEAYDAACGSEYFENIDWDNEGACDLDDEADLIIFDEEMDSYDGLPHSYNSHDDDYSDYDPDNPDPYV